MVPALALPSTLATKWCYDCRRFKPIEAFAFANKARGTRQSRCRACHAKYRRQHYLRNRATYIRQEVARIRRYRDESRPLIREYLRAHPCVDCGESDIIVLDFDHRDPSAKRHNVIVLEPSPPRDRKVRCPVRQLPSEEDRAAVRMAQGSWLVG